MKLSIGERIMIYRIRKGLKIGDLGNKVCGDLVAPHHKIKKIESGIQTPSDKDLQAIADVLEIDVELLLDNEQDGSIKKNNKQLVLNHIFLEHFPDIENYINLLNDSIVLNKKLVVEILKQMTNYIEEKIKNGEGTKSKRA